MSSEMKTLIIFDTNFLIIKDGRGVSYSSFEFNSSFDSIKEFRSNLEICCYKTIYLIIA